ncbi:MAG: hypothetical protein LBG27_12850 [Spirochaetaceae bacterium]|nr:hypothetical protein [Spirochaetaceae bacterium]
MATTEEDIRHDLSRGRCRDCPPPSPLSRPLLAKNATLSLVEHLIIKGAHEHNLKNIDLTLPRDKLIVVSSLSGSGKSFLAFDTIFAEGQCRYVESLSVSVNASFYDTKEFFQGRKEIGTMNAKSNDETYNSLIKDFREKHRRLAKKSKPKIYEYGFLKEQEVLWHKKNHFLLMKMVVWITKTRLPELQLITTIIKKPT